MRPIDADALKKVINDDINRCYLLRIGNVGPLAGFLDQIDAQPTVKLEPHTGHLTTWDGNFGIIKAGKSIVQFGLYCSECNSRSDGEFEYCPSCGAHMIEVENEH